ncbi:MAG TPA: cytochrome-c oxidase, cbb3-type subunit II, partial [Polyangiaceae bacterium]|nr:cytochrome-c oxidase, cbb3-type subunit II [Polyangiaceae bacterium]
HSTKMADLHFWIGTVGILLYVVSMWVSGITQGLMWRATDAGGTLTYPSFVETVVALKPLYWIRLVGGLLYLVGMLMMTVNLWKTARSGKAVDGEAEVIVPIEAAKKPAWTQVALGYPVVILVVLLVLAIEFGRGDIVTAAGFLGLVIAIGGTTIIVTRLAAKSRKGPNWHSFLEGRALIFTVLTIFAVVIGGVVQIVPSILAQPTAKEQKETRLATPLEIAGRDIYLREGCYTCHSQMIRPLDFETARYGDASTLAESRYDHPFQWGSKRTGPDLAREGGKNPSAWHYKHFVDPRSMTEGSNMPGFPALAKDKVDFEGIEPRLRALRSVGVPYTVEDVQRGPARARAQASEVTKDLAEQGIVADPDSEMVALIAYMQSLGLPPEKPAAAPTGQITASR